MGRTPVSVALSAETSGFRLADFWLSKLPAAIQPQLLVLPDRRLDPETVTPFFPSYNRKSIADNPYGPPVIGLSGGHTFGPSCLSTSAFFSLRLPAELDAAALC